MQYINIYNNIFIMSRSTKKDKKYDRYFVQPYHLNIDVVLLYFYIVWQKVILVYVVGM